MSVVRPLPPATVFSRFRIFDGTRLLDEDVLVVVGGRISRLTRSASDVPYPENAAVVDGQNKHFTLLPGLIDCHVHLVLRGESKPFDVVMKYHTPELAILSATHAGKALAAGFTTVRDLASPDFVGVGVRKMIVEGVIPGPHIVAAGQAVTMTGGHCDPASAPCVCLHDDNKVGVVADSPDEVRKVVRTQLKYGVDVVKVMATGGVLTDGTQPGSAQLTTAEMQVAVEEAHKAGRRVAAHALGANGVKNALHAGVDTIEHGTFLDDEAIQLLVQKRVTLVPTLCAVHHIMENIDALPVTIAEKARNLVQAHFSSFRNAHRAGVQIAMGTDAGTPFNFHGNNAKELALMVEHGFRPIEALQAATANAAQALGLDSDRGTISVGKRADLLLVEGDPTSDITVLLDKARLRVYKDGNLVARAGELVTTSTRL